MSTRQRPWFDYTYHSVHWSLWLRFGERTIHFDADPDTERLYADCSLLLPGRRLFRLWRWTVIVGD